MKSIGGVRLIFLTPDCAGERFAEDGYCRALRENGITNGMASFSKCSMDDAAAYVFQLQSLGVEYVVYPSRSCDVFHWEAANKSWLPRRPTVRPEEFPSVFVGIVEFVALLEEGGIRATEMDMHYGGPFDDFEITLFCAPDRLFAELAKRFPMLAGGD